MPTRLALLLSLTAFASCAGEDGVSYLTDLNDEPAGPNCPGGGVRVETGPDDNGNGTLEGSEIATTKYACAGAPGLTSVSPEAGGANCPLGGVKIDNGTDADGNGTLEGAEITKTSYVCGAGQAKVVKTFSSAGVPATTGQPIVINTLDIITPGPGTILAIASSDVWCTVTECPTGNPAASGYLWIADVALMTAPIAEYDYFFTQTATTEAIVRTAKFTVAAAGTHTFHMMGQDDVGTFQFYRNGLTLVYLP